MSLKHFCVYFFLGFLYIQTISAQNGRLGYFNISQYTIGGSVGLSHYFGDLNPSFDAFVPGFSASLFFQKVYHPYISLRHQISFAHFGFSDTYATNSVRKNRNLSFETDVLEISTRGDFHFFYYKPGSYGHNYTPYISLGLGLFYFEPYTYLDGVRYRLRDYETEGVSYSPISLSIPIGFGIKWSVNHYLNLSIELTNRITLTDYLDDVSTNYLSAPSKNPITNRLSNRTGNENMYHQQRGQSESVDMFMTLELGISYNLYKYYCP